jgi:hypothetical protein
MDEGGMRLYRAAEFGYQALAKRHAPAFFEASRQAFGACTGQRRDFLAEWYRGTI